MNVNWIETIGVVAAVTLPLWNIPLIARVIKRKSSRDMSLWWVMGVWVSFLLMAPSGFQSKEVVWKVFNIANLTIFTIVVGVVLRYRKGHPDDGRVEA